MILIRINHHLRIYAEAPQRLIHLLTSLYRHVEISLATQEQRRGLDAIRVQKRIRNLLIDLPRLRIPRRTDFVVVLNDVLIGTVAGDGESGARSACSGLKAPIAGDYVVGQNTAIAPAANAQ